MCINRGITGSSSQVFVFSVWDMQMTTWVSVLFSEPEINHIDLVAPLSIAHEEIVWFDIAMQEVFRMDKFNS